MKHKRNQLGYQVFTEKYTQDHFFGTEWKSQAPSRGKVQQAIENMMNAGVEFVDEMDNYTPPEFDLPNLEKGDINQHFDAMAYDLYKPVFTYLDRFCRKDLAPIPPVEVYVMKPGWTRYSLTSNGEWKIEHVPTPREKVLVFDCETFVKGSRFSHPIIGSAINDQACYLWLAESYVTPSIPYVPTLIPVGEGKILITWNGCYDHRRTVERYTLDTTKNILVDGMCLHKLVAGLDKSQAGYLGALEKKPYMPKPRWLTHRKGSKNSLLAAYNFHFNKEIGKGAKKARNIFVDAKSMEEIKNHNEANLEYAMRDVEWTMLLFKKLWKMYKRSATSPVVWAAHFIIHDAIVCVPDDWQRWVKETEAKFQEDKAEVRRLILKLADDTYEMWDDGEINVEADPFLKHLDWSYEEDEESPFYRIPKWYLTRIRPGMEFNTNPKTFIVTNLLRLRWDGYPIEHVKNKTKGEAGGWMYRKDGELVKVDHKNGDESNVGSVFNSFYLTAYENGVLTSDSEITKTVMELVNNNSYWNSIRGRCMEAEIGRIEDPLTGLPINLFAPEMAAHATVTGRSADKLLNTSASHLGKNKTAFEFKSQVTAPPGYKHVLFDFTAQELRVSALYSQYATGLTGSTSFAHNIITGDKKKGTDCYSVEGKRVEVSRSIGKEVLLSAQYLAGAKKISQRVYSRNPQMGMETIFGKVKQILANFRGTSDFETNTYSGGSASDAFNFMASIVMGDNPATPNLGTRMPPAITPLWNDKGIMPSNMNFTIQATCGSYGMLASTLVAINWLCKKAGLWARYSISLHDEIVYLVKEEDADLMAMIMNIAHAWSWSLLAYNLNMRDFPPKFAWIDSVEVLTHWSKELGADMNSDRFTMKTVGDRAIDPKYLADNNIDIRLLERLGYGKEQELTF